MTAKYFNVLTAIDSLEQAQGLARAVVRERVAACAQITEIQSIYRWRAEVHDEKEWRLDCKTTAEQLPRLMDVIRDLHSYEVPEIIALPIEEGNPAYLTWIHEETGN